jgi:integrase
MHVSARTVESYQQQLHRHIIPALGEIPLAQLQPHHLERYYAHALLRGRADGKGGLSPRTVRYQHGLIFEALRHGVKQGVLMRNVAEAVEPPRQSRAKKMAILAPEQVGKFLEAAQGTPYYVLFYTAIYTGMRRGELLGLRWCDVDLDLASLSVVQTMYKSRGSVVLKEPKSAHSRRLIALSPSLALLLREHRAEQERQRVQLGKPLSGGDYVFAYPDGRPLDPSTMSHTFVKVIAGAGIPHIRFHDLRHTHATLMLKAGIHPKVVSERLGHGDIRMTIDTYSHVLPGLQEAAAQRFDELLEKDVSKPLADEKNQISGWSDLNRRPPEPHSGALPGCATPRGFASGNMLS